MSYTYDGVDLREIPRSTGAQTSNVLARIPPQRVAVDGGESCMRSPILAAILSLIVAGLGQFYNGETGKGVIFMVIQFINGALTAVLIGWILLPIVGLWAILEAYMTARHNDERYGFR
jgi:TM2 domain-containing membrane protein YozV